MVAVVLLFTQPLVKLFASGFSGETLQLAVSSTRISILGIYFIVVRDIFAAYLKIHDNYLIPALIGFPMNLIIICSLFLGSKTNIYVLAIGSVLATAFQLLLLLPLIKKTGYKYQPFLRLNEKHIKRWL